MLRKHVGSIQDFNLRFGTCDIGEGDNESNSRYFFQTAWFKADTVYARTGGNIKEIGVAQGTDLKSARTKEEDFGSENIPVKIGDIISVKNEHNKIAKIKLVSIDDSKISFDYFIESNSLSKKWFAVAACLVILLVAVAGTALTPSSPVKMDVSVTLQLLERETRLIEKKQIDYDYVYSRGSSSDFHEKYTVVRAVPPWKFLSSIDITHILGGRDCTGGYSRLVEVSDESFTVEWGFSTAANYQRNRRAQIRIYATYTEYLDIFVEEKIDIEAEFVRVRTGREAYIQLPQNTHNIKAVTITLPNNSEVMLTAARVPEESLSFEFREETKRLVISQGK